MNQGRSIASTPGFGRRRGLSDLRTSSLSAWLPAAPIGDEIGERGRREWEGCRGIVVLCHYRPDFRIHTELADVLLAFAGSRTLLWLHGHEHPSSFTGAEWDDSGRLGDRNFFRSKVCSSADGRRGLGHRIEWNSATFTRTEVRGQWRTGQRSS